MSAVSSLPPAPLGTPIARARQWLIDNLFSTIGSSIVTVITFIIVAKALWVFLDWAVFNAVLTAPAARTCRENGTGACWAFVIEKWRFIIFGRYPAEEQWRPAIVTISLFLMIGATTLPRFWRRELIWTWAVLIVVVLWLMLGGLGLVPVATDVWGGLPVTLMLSLFSMILGFPLALFLALGRRSNLPVIRAFSTGFIELMRGVPLITILFMASLMLPLFLPPGVNIDKSIRALVGVTFFLGAYLAEDVRAGLMALPKGQYEAANSLGLSYWQATRQIVLPQAIVTVIAPMVGNFIGNFKNTSLVVIIGLFDLMLTTQTAMVDLNWRGMAAEAYLFASAIYFTVCYSMSQYSQWLERRFNKTRRR